MDIGPEGKYDGTGAFVHWYPSSLVCTFSALFPVGSHSDAKFWLVLGGGQADGKLQATSVFLIAQ